MNCSCDCDELTGTRPTRSARALEADASPYATRFFRSHSPAVIAARGISTSYIDSPLGLAAPGGLTSVQRSEQSLDVGLGLEIKSLALVLAKKRWSWS